MSTGKKVLLGLFAIAAVIFVVFAVVDWTLDPLPKRLNELRAAGEPVSLADLANPALTKADNARTYLLLSQAGVDKFEKTLGADREQSLLGKSPSELTSEDLELLQKSFAADPSLQGLIEQTASAPEFAFPIDRKRPAADLLQTVIKDISIARAQARYLRLRAIELSALGKGNEALKSTTMALQIASHCRQAPTLVSWLVGLAIENLALDTANEILRHSATSSQARMELSRELYRVNEIDNYRQALSRERAYFLASARELSSQVAGLPGLRMYMNFDLNKGLDLYAEQMEFADKAYGTYTQSVTQSVPKGALLSYSLSNQILSSFQAVRKAFDNNRARKQSLMILLAIEDSKAKGNTSPLLMEDLGLPKENTADPFTGKPLILKQTDAGPIIYSVGPNLTDDGGSLDDRRDIGIGPLRIGPP